MRRTRGEDPFNAMRREQEAMKDILKLPNETQQIDELLELNNWFGPEKDTIFFPLIQSYLSETNDLQSSLEKIRSTILAANAAGTYINQDFWCSILHSAKRIPYTDTDQHEKLLSIIRILKPNGRNAHVPEDDPNYPLHDALPEFTLWVAENMNDSPGCKSGFTIPEIHAWANLNYFLAIVMREGSERFWWAYFYAIHDALEYFKIGDGHRNQYKPGTAEEKYAAAVPAAAAWIFGAGKVIYELKGNLAPGGMEWSEAEDGFSKEKWAFWKERFGDVALLAHLREDTKSMARKAVLAMEKIENESVSDKEVL